MSNKLLKNACFNCLTVAMILKTCISSYLKAVMILVEVFKNVFRLTYEYIITLK